MCLGRRCPALGADKTICSHQETKHTLYCIFGSLRGPFIFTSQKQISLTVSRKADLSSKTLISTTSAYVETPLIQLQESWLQSQPQSGLRWCSVSSVDIRPIPLSSSSQPTPPPHPTAAPGRGQGQAEGERRVLSQSACLCIMSALKQAPEKINASDN